MAPKPTVYLAVYPVMATSEPRIGKNIILYQCIKVIAKKEVQPNIRLTEKKIVEAPG
jgi:hypothetical protein